jgi:serine/threonine protein kinase
MNTSGFMLTGEHVFPVTSVIELCSHHLHVVPKPPSERLGTQLPTDVEELVMGCLEKDPEDRIQTASELVARLRACACSGDWTVAEANAWWKERGAELASREDQGEVLSEKTVAVGLKSP